MSLISGFWHPYRNIYSLVDELGIKPFTNWMKSAQYSEEGLEVLLLLLILVLYFMYFSTYVSYV